MTAIRKGMKVAAAGVPYTMTVDKQGETLAVGTLWECIWTKPDGRECRRGFLATELTPTTRPPQRGARR